MCRQVGPVIHTATAAMRKDGPLMNIATLNKSQMIVFALLLVLTCIVLTFVMLATVAHIDVWHLFSFFSPNVSNGHF